MTDYTVDYNGIPWRVKGARDRDQAQRFIEASAQKDEVAWRMQEKQRIGKLAEMGIDLDRNYASEGMSTPEELAVGAGRTFVETGRGVKQIFGGKVDDRKITNERETFNLLDDEGIGAEDIGQLAPELFAFIGSGGQSAWATAANMGARGALLGASKEVTENESRTLNAVLGGAFGAGGGIAGKGIAATAGMFIRGAKFGANAAQGLQRLIGKSGSETASNVSKAAAQAQQLANSKSSALREVGETSLKELRTIVQQMNAIGRESVFRTQVNNWMKKSIKEVDGVNVLDVNKFIANIETMSKGQLTKELGANIGARLSGLRDTFRVLGKITDMDETAARTTLNAIMSDNAAATAARALAKAADEGADQATTSRLAAILQTTVARSPAAAAAGAGPQTQDIVEQIKAEADANGLTLRQ